MIKGGLRPKGIKRVGSKLRIIQRKGRLAIGKPKVKTKKGKTLPTPTKLKKKADAIFSQYIRHKYADKEGNLQCYTCPTIRPIKKMQNGHFISRQYLTTRYDERNCRPQCWFCNSKGFGDGRPVEFSHKLEIEMPGITQTLFKEAQRLTLGQFNFQEIIDRYKPLLTT